MELQARIAAAPADFDNLLRHGVSIEAAIEVAAVENGVTIEVLSARAGRTLTLEERRNQALGQAELVLDVAAKKDADRPDPVPPMSRRLVAQVNPAEVVLD